ncbi:hypothetical protein ACFWSF_09420 [Streptomyces sp. NPDC058611]|uniref:hypothetical protein n=1 Tax=unclassified Streptomyces TaxID=2593676 RepID=UPI003652484F
MITKLAAKATVTATSTVQWLKSRIEQGGADDRGDISITTVIIWVAAVGGAITIAGSLAVLITKYNGRLAGI